MLWWICQYLVHEAMKRKRKAAGTSSTSRNTSEANAGSPGPTPPEPNVKNPEPAENGVKGEERKMKDQDMEGPADVILNTTPPEVSSPLPLSAVLKADHQGHHQDVNAGDNIALLESSAKDITEQVNGGIPGHPPSMLTKSSVGERCPQETDSITEITGINEQMNGDNRMSETSDCPLEVIEGIKDEVNHNGEAGEMLLTDTGIDTNVSDSKGDIQMPQTPDLPDLPQTPDIPERPSQVQPIISQTVLRDSQRINEASPSPDHDLRFKGRDAVHPQDPSSPAEDTWTPMTDQTLLSGMKIMPSQQADDPAEDPRRLTNGLELPDSQLLGAWEDTLSQGGKRVENHISDHVTPAWHSGDIPEASTCSPGLPVNGALDQESRGPQQRRTEDASSTVQGLIMELSNINRLIMSTYRELRQKRVRHVPGRGSGKERRRREM
ncbi:break repair meiotic recombinase recruitment factor 1 isoform X2 [Dendropsophus ebraccatus]|uniref:break repair meiotic recombinase recruitment factor 1 isoform X2 n=1 Tax=Dendropsophus ebraccatus TaxID=150705 RepID=UPI0038310B2D